MTFLKDTVWEKYRVIFSNKDFWWIIHKYWKKKKSKHRSAGVHAALRCFDNTIALLAVNYSSAIKSEHLLAAGSRGKSSFISWSFREKKNQRLLFWIEDTQNLKTFRTKYLGGETGYDLNNRDFSDEYNQYTNRNRLIDMVVLTVP